MKPTTVRLGPIPLEEFTANGGRMLFHCEATDDIPAGRLIRAAPDWTAVAPHAAGGPPADGVSARAIAKGEVVTVAALGDTADVSRGGLAWRP